jgi:hypothetical protein
VSQDRKRNLAHAALEEDAEEGPLEGPKLTVEQLTDFFR